MIAMAKGIEITENYYKIRLKDKYSNVVKWRSHDIGRKGHAIRKTGKTKTGKWFTSSYLINKKDAFYHKYKNVFFVYDKKTLHLLRSVKTKYNFGFHVRDKT